MEVPSLCIQILVNVFVLLPTLPGQSCTLQKPDFPTISPDRLQFFEFESVSVSCGGNKDINAWRVVRRFHKMNPANESKACSIPAPFCTIHHTYERHSGEYWCENDEGERSQALNISITAGSVILNIPVRPVKEGSDVLLSCINNLNNQTQITDFYKDGLHLRTNFDNVLTLQDVSKSDEGLYRCSISGAGDSPESWLAVGEPQKGPPPIFAHSGFGVSPFRVVCHLVVISPYCITTGLWISAHCYRRTGEIPVGTTEMTDFEEIPPSTEYVDDAGVTTESN